MKAIWKYKLAIAHTQTLTTPGESTILSVGEQNGDLVLWVMVEPESRKDAFFIIDILGTGQATFGAPRQFINTVQIGDMVWHVFKRL